MLYAYRVDGLIALADEIYIHALEDYDLPTKGEKSIKKTILDIIMDKTDDNHQEVLKTLLSIPKEAVEPLVLNTIGYEFLRRPALQARFFERDYTAGFYLNTFLAEDGKFFSKKEWTDVIGLMGKYAKLGACQRHSDNARVEQGFGVNEDDRKVY